MSEQTWLYWKQQAQNENLRIDQRLLAWSEAYNHLNNERAALAEFIQSRGYVRCDIPACNCNSFHRGNAEERLTEIRDALGHRAEGQTLLTAVENLITSTLQKED